MKRLIVIFYVISVLFFNTCKVSTQQINSGVYIVGNDGNTPVYWINDIKYVLPYDGDYAIANCITFYKNNIYIVGTEYTGIIQNPVFWLNGTRNELPYDVYRGGGANAIATDDNNIYIVGHVQTTPNYFPVIWINGKLYGLIDSNVGIANDIIIDSKIIYITGWDRNNAVYWIDDGKNENMEILPDIGDNAFANSIIKNNNNIYIVGSNRDKGNSFPILWENSKRIPLNILGSYGVAHDISINNNDIHIVGYDKSFISDFKIPIHWINGIRNTLPITETDGEASSIFISDNNVYIGGVDGSVFDSTKPVYWKNNEKINLPIENEWGWVYDIIVIE